MAELEENTTKKITWDDIRSKFTSKNIIIAIFVFFFIWVTFLDQNSLIKRYQIIQEQKELINTRNDYQKKIKETQTEIEALNTKDYIEKIAREKHLMKKENEDVYIVTTPNK
mgnify:CR=1 FL=1